MSAKTDPPSSAGPGESSATPGTGSSSASQFPGASVSRTSSESTSAPSAQDSYSLAAPRRKPRISLFIATACGLGYLPKAPGTWGSLAGLAMAMLPFWGLMAVLLVAAKIKGDAGVFFPVDRVDVFLCSQVALAVLIGAIGLFSSTATAKFWNLKDPQRVVIDEVSGQHLALLLGCALPILRNTRAFLPTFGLGLISIHSALNWKYLALGFILFRAFDIWKPFPARQAESLPGGWGIMADDWIAGIYAGLGLWLARALGL